LHAGVLELAAKGFVTGASRRNLDAYGHDVTFGPDIGERERALLTDPQTSGGLLVACSPDSVSDVLAIFRGDGFTSAAPVGRFAAGVPRVTVA
jgi:selenide, water dikinase